MNEQRISAERLYFLWHPQTTNTFSGYGITIDPDRKDYLVGLLMVDRPQPADPIWLAGLKALFGGYELYVMSSKQERGLGCQMWVAPDSQVYVRHFDTRLAARIAQTLIPFLNQRPRPRLKVRWHKRLQLWTSEVQETDQEAPK